MKETGAEERARQIAREHGMLHGLARELRAALDTPKGSEQRAALKDLVASFHGHLARHFVLEEEGGYLGGADAYSPGVERKLATLMGQHADLLARVGVIRTHLRGQDATAGIEEELLSVLDDLAGHEAAENALLEELFSRDSGVGD